MLNDNPTSSPMQSGGVAAVDENEQVDFRQGLVNAGKIGPIGLVSIPESMITRLNGIVLDVDPARFNRASAASGVGREPSKFYERVLKPMLARHPVLARAEVRVSGTGLHVIIWLADPVEFASEGERQRWSGIVRSMQRLVPTDPNAPGITALTRPVGSTNSKNGKPVVTLNPGTPVSAAEILAAFEELRMKPFATLANTLWGTTPIAPCPKCHAKGSSLAVFDKIGKCYGGGCGKVTVASLYDYFMTNPKKEK